MLLLLRLLYRSTEHRTFVREDEDTDAQGASWGWWGWLEEYLVRRVTDLKKGWKGKVRVHMVRTDGFRSQLSLSAILIW